MGCLCSVCICNHFLCWNKHTGKRLRRSTVFSCCTKRKYNTNDFVTSDSILQRQMKQTTEDTHFISKQEASITLTEEVDCSPESSQQLEPEILNCAADLSFYKRTNTLLSASNNGQDIENGEKPGDFLDTQDISTDHFQGIMASGPLNATLVNQITKRSSGEWTPPGDENTDMGSLIDCSKRSKLLQDSHPHVIAGDGTVSGCDSSSEQTHLSEVSAAVNSCTDSRDDEISDMAYAPSHVSQHPEHNTTEVPNAVDGISSSETTQRTNTKEIVVHSCALEKDLSLDTDEDLYRDEEEIEKEKIQKVAATIEKDALKLGVEPEVDIIEYCQREWRGTTTVAQKMKELPEKLIKKYDWIMSWRFRHSYGNKKTWVRIKTFLELLKKKWAELSEMKTPDKKQAACDEIFQNEEEYALYEAVKFLMLKTAIDLYNANAYGKEVPVFSWLLFARNTSSNPCDFMKNHLNQVGHSGGLEQVEMFLLGYALQHTIKVYRLYKYGTDEFITQYPDDQANWPVVTLITEDDRHYNVPVRVCEETSL
ncbi:ubiquitin thioesterase otulin isoform X2 [Pseudophryne corroboree]|uniref:ubiquitin thioesterase otulin isoform X2 n=1 Tax=Pseudophryne corroboree TaxID=495146 RepID=UPI00308180D7